MRRILWAVIGAAAGLMAAGCAAMTGTAAPAEGVSAQAVAEKVEAMQATQVGELFLFIYSAGPAWKPGAPMREQGLGPHADYIGRLTKEGRVFAGGGFASDMGGMAIAVAANVEEAQAMLAADPAITSGIFVAKLEHWRPRFRTDAPLPKPE